MKNYSTLTNEDKTKIKDYVNNVYAKSEFITDLQSSVAVYKNSKRATISMKLFKLTVDFMLQKKISKARHLTLLFIQY